MPEYSKLIAKAEDLGRVTRNFASSLETYSKDVDTAIKSILSCTRNNGWTGGLADQYDESLRVKLDGLKKIANQMMEKKTYLEEKAIAYDQFIEKLAEIPRN